VITRVQGHNLDILYCHKLYSEVSAVASVPYKSKQNKSRMLNLPLSLSFCAVPNPLLIYFQLNGILSAVENRIIFYISFPCQQGKKNEEINCPAKKKELSQFTMFLWTVWSDPSKSFSESQSYVAICLLWLRNGEDDDRQLS
jgi:hypothetical protein